MNHLFIFNSKYKVQNIETENTVVFFHQPILDFDDFISSLNKHFQENTYPVSMFLLIPEYLHDQFNENLSTKFEDFERVIPTKYNRKNPFEFIYPVYYDENGSKRLAPQINDKVNLKILEKACHDALINIFNNRGGLIKSENAHHYVFPSGKHCDYFLRTGNILQKGNEIAFIAFNILHKLNDRTKVIYCDTSSINSLALALIQLKTNFKKSFQPPYLESFGSYSAFEKGDFSFLNDSLFVVSSSSSSRIIRRLLERNVDVEQIVLIYCVGRPDEFKSNIICDLEFDSKFNELGIQPFKSYLSSEQCILCRNGSIPIEVTGDVFQLEKPLIKKIGIKVTDAPKFHAAFIKKFHKKLSTGVSFIRSHHFERIDKPGLAQPSYEIFFDVEALIDEIDKFPSFKTKLDRYIDQYIPAKTKFIIFLPDKSSEKLARYIYDKVKQNLSKPEEIVLVNQNDVFENSDFGSFKDQASAVIVCSSLVGGTRLLYLSREMRDYENLSLVYFVGFSRTDDEPSINFLKGNLTMGNYGINTNSFVQVESLFTPNEKLNTPWVVEEHFLTKLKLFCEDFQLEGIEEIVRFIDDRLDTLEQGYINKGLVENLFLPKILGGIKELSINKNFAFYSSFEGYHKNASQADIYFTVAVTLNNLRVSTNGERKLLNTQFVRTILEADNFNRYNDGIIQSAILRASNQSELSYDLDKSESQTMLNVLIGIVEFCEQDHGEALLEFLYSMCIKKLKLKLYHLEEIVNKIDSHSKAGSHPIIKAFTEYLKKLHVNGSEEVLRKYELKLDLR